MNSLFIKSFYETFTRTHINGNEFAQHTSSLSTPITTTSSFPNETPSIDDEKSFAGECAIAHDSSVTVTPENQEYIPFVMKTHIDSDSPNDPTQPLTQKQMPCPTTIRHLVISGGGEMGLSFYSALRESNKSGFWDIKNIESIYCTSIGSMFAITIALLPHFGWDIYDDFILKRPWHKVFDFHFSNFANSFHKKGIFAKEIIHEIFKPIFNAIDMSIHITLKEFHEYTNIDLHIMTTELARFELIDLSYKTHPDWELLDAVYCSSGLPILFAPHCSEDGVYLDGGFISNFPINNCLEQVENPDEILGFKRIFHEPTNITPKMTSLFDYLFYILFIVFTKVCELPKTIKNQIEVYNHTSTISFYKMYNTINSYDERVILLEDGIRCWEEFYEKTYGNDLAIATNTVAENAVFP
jgi:predicted acylesterase/phospholipase RssA